jgi:hypothetical protein
MHMGAPLDSRDVSTLHTAGYNETACGANDLIGDPG